MNKRLTIKNLIIAIATITTLVSAFLIHALAGLNSHSVVYDMPPKFVEQYAAKQHNSKTYAVNEDEVINNTKITEDFSKEAAIVRDVFFKDESPEEMLQLFSHPDKNQRVKIASAFAAINVEYTHNEESGFPPKRDEFYKSQSQHLPDIRNALFEALIVSAQEQTENYIPYTVAWMPGQGEETVEVLYWAAKHHSDWWVRRFSVYFVVAFGGNEELAQSLLEFSVHDPEYKVRKQVLDLKLNRFMGV